MNEKVDDWLTHLPESHRLRLAELRQLVLETDKRFVEEIKWGRPCYSVNKLVCYLQTAKEHVTIGFQQGAHLEDVNNLLVGEGKDMRHVKCSLTEDFDRLEMSNLLSEAVEFDQR